MPDGAQKGPSFEEISETFELMDDWMDRYRYVIELGQGLEGLDAADKTAETKVDGCASQVWLKAEPMRAPGEPVRLRFEGDSDAHIVRGLIAVLRALLSGRPASEIISCDAVGAFDALGFGEHLSSQRSNGLRAMIRRLKDEANALA
ncbi:MAG: SufE family protein [Pseudomonadota bacterium]